jgi:hypothetical protein
VDNLATWVFGDPLVLSAAALEDLNNDLHDPTGTAVADNLYLQGGYEAQWVDTQLVVQNNQNTPLRVINIGVIKSCTAPLDGTLFFAPGQGADSGIKIGFNLDSAYSYALQLPSGNIGPYSYPYYFANYTVSINPGAQQVFDLFAQAFYHACAFRYLLTILEGSVKVYQVIGDGSAPFRISGLRTGYSAYPVIYTVHEFSSAVDGSGFSRVAPKTFNTAKE